jgi:hypothetical protein
LASAAVWQWQCVISAAAADSSVAAMFSLFITHDEYFVRCRGSGGGYYNVFDLSSYKLLNGRWQCGGSAAMAAWQRRAVLRRCWQGGSGDGRAVAARRWQHSKNSVAVVAVQRQRGSGKHGGSVGSAAAAALAARQRRPAWRLRRKFGGIAASSAASEWGELRCRHMPPRWRRRHRRQQRWRGHYQQSTIN